MPNILMLLALPALLSARAPADSLDAMTRSAVIDTLSRALVRRYVSEDTARMIGELLHRRLRDGAYDSLATRAAFARAVSLDMRAINHDLHLALLPSAPGGAGATFFANREKQNFGITRAEVLPGNVGYLAIDAFMAGPGFDSAVVNALRLLEHTDAMIVDVRRNPGGDGQSGTFVLSHFLGATPVPTVRAVNRASGDTMVISSLASVPGPRRPDVPLYVLTSRNTGSAAEGFAFTLQDLSRAKILGERTAGAGHQVGQASVGNGFVAMISVARVSSVATGREWEQVGVQPDIAVPAVQALDAALDRATGKNGPQRVIEMAHFRVPAANVAKVAPAQRDLRKRLAQYPGFLGNLSYQSVSDSTSFVDYALWDTQQHADSALTRAMADQEIAGKYFPLMSEVPFYGHAVALGDPAACALKAQTPGSVALLRVVGLKPSATEFDRTAQQYAKLLRDSGAPYVEISRFTEYPEFQLELAQFDDLPSARATLPRVRATPAVAQPYFGAANVTVFAGLYRAFGDPVGIRGCTP